MDPPTLSVGRSHFQFQVCLVVFFHFQSNFNRTLCKQTVGTRPDAEFCGVWSGSAMFAHVPQKGRQDYIVKSYKMQEKLLWYHPSFQ